MSVLRYGPNVVATAKEIRERKEALQKVTDDQLKKCKNVLLKGGDSISALVVGESGTGKSTVINALLGKEIAKVGSGPITVTEKVRNYSGLVGEVDVNIVELPELDMDEVRRYKLQLQRLDNVDVVYVCQKLYDRHRRSAIETLRRLSVVFGKDIYKKAVFVMTFANDMPKSWGRGIDRKTLQAKVEKDWNDQAAAIRRTLQSELQMASDEAERTLVLPAGYFEKDDPDSSREIFGLTNDWINDLILASVNTNILSNRKSSESSTSSESTKKIAAPAFLRIMAESLDSSDFEDSSNRGYSKVAGDCEFNGYVGIYLGAIGQCVAGLSPTVLENILTMVKEVVAALFHIEALCRAVGKVFEAINQSGTTVVAAEVVSIVGGVVVGAVTAVVLATVVITILAVILSLLVAIVLGIIIIAGVAIGGTAGAFVGGIIGSVIAPGIGTAVGASIGATVGGFLGGVKAYLSVNPEN